LEIEGTAVYDGSRFWNVDSGVNVVLDGGVPKLVGTVGISPIVRIVGVVAWVGIDMVGGVVILNELGDGIGDTTDAGTITSVATGAVVMAVRVGGGSLCRSKIMCCVSSWFNDHN
jgi:hypothetical protein